ncbi:LOG family protein [Actinomadura sp. NTSP31]|uniref:LOG family protein n=1 Tax=Actinomadura sp. NTSP31 TaxID=1735447 RepID=UPI0035C18EC4
MGPGRRRARRGGHHARAQGADGGTYAGVPALLGGLGTLEELLEVWTWRTLPLHGKSLGLLDIGGFWDPLVALIRRAADAGFMDPATADDVVVGDRLDDVLQRLADATGAAASR